MLLAARTWERAVSKCDPFFFLEEEGGGRAGDMSGKEKRQRGGERSERGIGDGGFRRQGALSGRPLTLLVQKTLFYSEELPPGFVFLCRGRAPSRWSPLREFVFVLLSSLLLCRPLTVGRMSLSLFSVRACLSHNSICNVCVCGFLCVLCFFFHIIYKLIYKLMGMYVYHI